MDSVKSKLIVPSTKHKIIDGSLLSAEREKTGLSQAAFAEECGHTQQYQQRLESFGSREIKTAKAEQILAVLKKYNQSLV